MVDGSVETASAWVKGFTVEENDVSTQPSDEDGDGGEFDLAFGVPPGPLDLAERLQLPVEDLLHLIGGGWERIESEDPGQVTDEGVSWFVAGDPIQVLLRVSNQSQESGALRCYCPEVTWYVQRPQVVPGRLTGEGPIGTVREWLPAAAAEAQSLRRGQFRWCSLCRTLNAPEHMGSDICHGCMSTYFGVVF
jgi:hypothetical protein